MIQKKSLERHDGEELLHLTTSIRLETLTKCIVLFFGFSVQLKLGLSVSEFVDKVKNVKVMEASTPRTK